MRVNAGKYLQGANNQQNYTISNPAMDGRNGRIGPNFQTTVNRTWTDANGNFLPDCIADESGGERRVRPVVIARVRRARPAKRRSIRRSCTGWGVRPSDWQLGIGVQQEILPRTSIEVSYNRRWFKGFFVFKNTLLDARPTSPAQTITAPLNANLPGGGGYPMTYQVLNPGVPTNIQDLYTSADNYGGETVYWHGVDITISSRHAQRLRVPGRDEHRAAV